MMLLGFIARFGAGEFVDETPVDFVLPADTTIGHGGASTGNNDDPAGSSQRSATEIFTGGPAGFTRFMQHK
jgi:hypothetical protein